MSHINGANMKNAASGRILPNTTEIPDVIYYSNEACRLRGDFLASKLKQLSDWVKGGLKTKVHSDTQRHSAGA